MVSILHEDVLINLLVVIISIYIYISNHQVAGYTLNIYAMSLVNYTSIKLGVRESHTHEGLIRDRERNPAGNQANK